MAKVENLMLNKKKSWSNRVKTDGCVPVCESLNRKIIRANKPSAFHYRRRCRNTIRLDRTGDGTGSPVVLALECFPMAVLSV